MNKKESAEFVVETLEKLYPETPVPLNHKDNYSLLIAVLLSAQCTDERVNKITPLLFAKADNPKDMIKLGEAKIKEIIRPCGLSPMKSKGIFGLSKIILEKHNGKVPNTFKDLEELPAVGHKTASVVMSQAFGFPAFPVDTHIHRLAFRWKFSTGKNVVKTEQDLKRIFPENLWNKLHLQIIFFGRAYCMARSHKPEECPICKVIGRKDMEVKWKALKK